MCGLLTYVLVVILEMTLFSIYTIKSIWYLRSRFNLVSASIIKLYLNEIIFKLDSNDIFFPHFSESLILHCIS